MADSLAPLLADLAAEHAALDAIVSALDASQWDTPTPSVGWRVCHQIGHLTFFDRAAARAVLDPEGFAAEREAAIARLDDYVAAAEARVDGLEPAVLLAEWRTARADLLAAAAPLDAAARIEWYGPPMGARSFLTARLMETWAHGRDVADAVGQVLPDTDRLRHVAHLGVVTRGWSYLVRGQTPPTVDVRVELSPPGDGDDWTWGDAGATDRISGPAVDFCLVVTQRRPVGATDLAVAGPLAAEWMGIAQVFAGPPTTTDPTRHP